MLPRVDLPEVLLEVDAWTGCLREFAHVALTDTPAGSRMEDLATSMAAVLVAEGCNLGFAPVTKPGQPALTRDRLSHVAQNYLRTDTLTAANARLIDARAGIDTARLWGAADPHALTRQRGVIGLAETAGKVCGGSGPGAGPRRSDACPCCLSRHRPQPGTARGARAPAP
jgi:hypothetical protein